jgi:hypothetical protein
MCAAEVLAVLQPQHCCNAVAALFGVIALPANCARCRSTSTCCKVKHKKIICAHAYAETPFILQKPSQAAARTSSANSPGVPLEKSCTRRTLARGLRCQTEMQPRSAASKSTRTPSPRVPPSHALIAPTKRSQVGRYSFKLTLCMRSD